MKKTKPYPETTLPSSTKIFLHANTVGNVPKPGGLAHKHSVGKALKTTHRPAVSLARSIFITCPLFKP